MAAGIPGAGIGGLFYLAHALLLPLRGLFRRNRGQAVGWRSLLRVAGLAAGILLGIGAAGWLLGLVAVPAAAGANAALFGAAGAARTARLLGAATLLMSVGTLLAVLLSVQLARVLVRNRR